MAGYSEIGSNLSRSKEQIDNNNVKRTDENLLKVDYNKVYNLAATG